MGSRSDAKQKNLYAVVGTKLKNDIEVSAICQNWFGKNRKCFYYPPIEEKNSYRFLQNGTEPDIKQWLCYEVYKIYEESISKLKTAETFARKYAKNSEGETTDYSNKKRSRKNKRAFSPNNDRTSKRARRDFRNSDSDDSDVSSTSKKNGTLRKSSSDSSLDNYDWKVPALQSSGTRAEETENYKQQIIPKNVEDSIVDKPLHYSSENEKDDQNNLVENSALNDMTLEKSENDPIRKEELLQEIRTLIQTEMQNHERKMKKWIQSELKEAIASSTSLIFNNDLSHYLRSNLKQALEKVTTNMVSETFVQESDNETDEAVDAENGGQIESFNANIFPIRSLKTFMDFDKKLENKHFNKGFNKYLSSIHGRSTKDLINRITGCIIKDQVPCVYNMTGVNRKLPFASTNLYGQIMNRVSIKFPYSERKVANQYLGRKLTLLADSVKSRKKSIFVAATKVMEKMEQEGAIKINGKPRNENISSEDSSS